jgi:predicted enzyme related to lactoylglutathione lyase
MAVDSALVTGVDFVSIPSDDFEASVAFYGETLGLPRSAFNLERGYAEFETGNLTLSVLDPVRMGMGMEFHASPNAIALHVEDMAAARERLTDAGVTFAGDTFDSGVCPMSFLSDPSGNALMLHHRYAPRTDD